MLAEPSDANPTLQSGGSEVIAIASGPQAINLGDADDAIRGRAESHGQRHRSIRPVRRKNSPFPAPGMHARRRSWEHEVGSVRADELCQPGKRLLDKRADLGRGGVGETRRYAGNHVLEGGALLQRPPPPP